MWLSTRSKFREGDEGWASYLAFIGLPLLKEVRSIDSWLNRYAGRRGTVMFGALRDIPSVLETLPRPADENQYYLLFIDAQNEPLPPDTPEYRFLGYDLSDETHTSSLLNCGPWKGRLQELTQRLNQYGLLSLEDALTAQEWLPTEWEDDPHADVTVWALYEVEPGTL